MAPQEIDQLALREMKEVVLPAAKPHQEISDKYDPSTGVLTPGRTIAGRVIPGTLPTRDIAHEDFPRVVYLHPKKAWKKMLLPVDGHGNKELQWVANEAKSRVVKDEKELEAALKQGFSKKHYVPPAMPVEEPEEEPVAK